MGSGGNIRIVARAPVPFVPLLRSASIIITCETQDQDCPSQWLPLSTQYIEGVDHSIINPSMRHSPSPGQTVGSLRKEMTCKPANEYSPLGEKKSGKEKYPVWTSNIYCSGLCQFWNRQERQPQASRLPLDVVPHGLSHQLSRTRVTRDQARRILTSALFVRVVMAAEFHGRPTT